MALRGGIGWVSRERVRGWAFDPDRPDIPVNLVVLADGEVVARAVADRPRPDLVVHTKGSGRHGFDILLRTPLSRGVRHLVEVRREEDGAPLPNSPRPVEPSAAFDAPARAEWRAILAAAETEEDFASRIDFLLGEVEALRAAYAARRAGVDARARRLALRWAGEAAPEGFEKPRALVLDIRMPDLARDAGSRAIVSHMASLQRLGFDVNFAPANLAGDPSALEAMGVACATKPLVGSVESLLARQRGAYDLVYLHRATMAASYLELARIHQPRATLLYSVADLHHLRMARQAAVERRPELSAAAERIFRQEIAAAWAADVVVTHSRAEADILAKHMPRGKVVVVPWAVEPGPVRAPFAERAGVAFIGGFGHAPNVDAAHVLIGEIMPEVWRRDPGIRCLLVGADMPAALRARASGRVEALGAVADLAGVFERVRLTVAPLAFGAGLKGKVLDSLAAGIPCVCSPVAAEGFDFAPPLSDLVGREPGELARLILSLHADAKRNGEAAAAGLAYVAKFAAEAAVDEALGRAVGARRSKG